MPLPHYHVGPGLLLASVLGRRVDLPVLVTASLVVDLEVPVYALLELGLGAPRYGHTLFVSTGVGLAWALVTWPLQPWFERVMRHVDAGHRRSLGRALASGVLGAWTHVLLDGSYRLGAGLLWPSALRNPLCRFDRGDAEWFGMVTLVLGLAIFLARGRRRTPE